MKNFILFFLIVGVLTLSGCKKESFGLKDPPIYADITTDKLLDNITTPETQTPLIEVEEKKYMNDGIHKSNVASSTTELENKIDSIINQIGDLP